MGDAKKKLEREGEMVHFDCAEIGLKISSAERWDMQHRPGDPAEGCDAALVPLRAFEFATKVVVGAAYPQGMDRTIGRIYAAWLDQMEGTDPAWDITRGAVLWLRKHYSKDDLQTRPGIASWRETIVDYLDALVVAPAIGSDSGAATDMPDAASTADTPSE